MRSASSAAQLLGAGRPWSAGGRRASASPSRPSSLAASRRTARRSPRPRRGGRPSARSRARPAAASQLTSEAREPSAAGADPRDQRVALGQASARTRGGSPRAPATARPRTDRGARGATTGAPLTSSSRSGRKTLTSGRSATSSSRSTRRAVGPHPLRLPGREADRQLVRAVLALGRDDDPRGAAPEADDLALVGGPAGAAGAAEVQRLDQVRLAGAVGPGDHRQARRRSATSAAA